MSDRGVKLVNEAEWEVLSQRATVPETEIKIIARNIGRSPSCVAMRLQRATKKLGVRNNHEACILFREGRVAMVRKHKIDIANPVHRAEPPTARAPHCPDARSAGVSTPPCGGSGEIPDEVTP